CFCQFLKNSPRVELLFWKNSSSSLSPLSRGQTRRQKCLLTRLIQHMMEQVDRPLTRLPPASLAPASSGIDIPGQGFVCPLLVFFDFFGESISVRPWILCWPFFKKVEKDLSARAGNHLKACKNVCYAFYRKIKHMNKVRKEITSERKQTSW
ncbi:MAG: hypothetical protein Q4F43_05875, partial [Eubacteriales bacterium]|nr:hypothetical protein [Eubacteriales bacterium]